MRVHVAMIHARRMDGHRYILRTIPASARMVGAVTIFVRSGCGGGGARTREARRWRSSQAGRGGSGDAFTLTLTLSQRARGSYAGARAGRFRRGIVMLV